MSQAKTSTHTVSQYFFSPLSCQNRFRFASVLILKGKHSGGGKKIRFPSGKCQFFFEKENKNTPKPNRQDLDTGLAMPHRLFLEESPPAPAGPPGRNGLGERGTPPLVLLSQKMFSFQFFYLTAGAAGQFFCKTETVFLSVFAGMEWGSPSCWKHL